MAQRNFDRQTATIRNLEVPPNSHYELVSYSVEEWAGNNVAVTRVYRPIGSVNGASWHELIKIGPRGATKTIYKNFY